MRRLTLPHTITDASSKGIKSLYALATTSKHLVDRPNSPEVREEYPLSIPLLSFLGSQRQGLLMSLLPPPLLSAQDLVLRASLHLRYK